MKDALKTPYDINKIEFWGATILYVISLFLLISGAIRYGDSPEYATGANFFHDNNVRYSYFSNYMIPLIIRYTIFYGAYILLTFHVVPQFISRRNITLNIIITLFVFLAIGLMMGTTDTWLKGYLSVNYADRQEFYNGIFKGSFTFAVWLLFIFLIYTVIKNFAIYLLTNSKKIQEKYQLVTRDGIVVFILWMLSYFLMLIAGAPSEVITGYSLIIPFGIGLYWFSLSRLIPETQNRKRKYLLYLWKVALILLLSILPLALILYAILNDGMPVSAILTMNAGFQLVITATISWLVYKYRVAAPAELNTLRLALGNSTANLHLLRSQINPHFLFNSLNTLYGTALQENADRTSEGIQRLGDMMRFMLEENMQDTIPLTREIDYIKNYIALQKLRTQSSPDIMIQAELDERPNTLSITPMLLIPFIENAFKHGISLREPSHIKITLLIEGQSVFFDVYNSIHPKSGNDPEKNNSGVGLNNVKQRLQLFYPNRHELIIRENAREFFVHLTIQLHSVNP